MLSARFCRSPTTGHNLVKQIFLDWLRLWMEFYLSATPETSPAWMHIGSWKPIFSQILLSFRDWQDVGLKKGHFISLTPFPVSSKQLTSFPINPPGVTYTFQISVKDETIYHTICFSSFVCFSSSFIERHQINSIWSIQYFSLFNPVALLWHVALSCLIYLYLYAVSFPFFVFSISGHHQPKFKFFHKKY